MSKLLNHNLVLAVLLAVANAKAAPSEIQYLSGADKEHTVPWEFRISAGRNSGVWTNIPVPSCWETMGFGSYEYVNIKTTEFGQYRHTFQVPAAWSGKRVFLFYEGSMTDTETLINGIAPGALHQGGFCEFNYEVTSNLVFGTSVTNLLEVTAHKVSADASVNHAERTSDYWVFGGIFRPVYLEACPYANIERVGVDAKASGQITVTAFLSGITNNCTVAVYVTDSNNVALGGEFSAPVSVGNTNVVLAANLPTPNPWSSEFPNLY